MPVVLFLFVPLFCCVVLIYVFPSIRATTLQEELKKKSAALSDTQQQLERGEQEKAALRGNLDKVSQEAKAQQAELDRRAQSLAANLLKAQQEREAQQKELASTQESLAKANKALKESQKQLDAERKSHKSSMEEKVGSVKCKLIQIKNNCSALLIFLNPQEKTNEKARQELLKTNEAITKAMKESKGQVEQMKEVRF